MTRSRSAPLVLAVLTALSPGAARAEGAPTRPSSTSSSAPEPTPAATTGARSSTSSPSNRLVPNRNVRLQHRPHVRAAQALRRRAPLLHRRARGRDRPARHRATCRPRLARIAPNVAVLDVETIAARRHHLHRPQGSRLARPRPAPAGAAARPLPGHRRARGLRAARPASRSRPSWAATTRVALTSGPHRGHGPRRRRGRARAARRCTSTTSGPPPACAAPCELDAAAGRAPALLHRARAPRRTPRQVIVVAAAASSATAALRPLTGSLVVSADERGALVTVDGARRGLHPGGDPRRAGRAAARCGCSLRGYAPVEREVEVKPASRPSSPDVDARRPSARSTAVSRYAEASTTRPARCPSSTARGAARLRLPHHRRGAARHARLRTSPTTAPTTPPASAAWGSPTTTATACSSSPTGSRSTTTSSTARTSAPTGASISTTSTASRSCAARARCSTAPAPSPASSTWSRRPRDEPNSVHVDVGTYDNAVFHASRRLPLQLRARTAGVWASASFGALRRASTWPSRCAAGARRAGDPDGAQGRRVHQRGHGRARVVGPGHRAVVLPARAIRARPSASYGTAFDDPRTGSIDTRMMVELRFEPKPRRRASSS